MESFVSHTLSGCIDPQERLYKLFTEQLRRQSCHVRHSLLLIQSSPDDDHSHRALGTIFEQSLGLVDCILE